MKNEWKQEINLKKKGKRDLPASKDKNLAKNDKKMDGGAESQRGEREKQETIWKVTLKKSNSAFLKNLIHEFQLVENQPRSVETDRDSLSQILKISIGRKTEWTDRIWQRLTIFLRKNTIFEKQVDLTQSIEI